MRLKVIFLGVPLAFLLFDGRFLLSKNLYGVVEKVLDGDTIVVAGQRVRLIYIDAPELKQVSSDKALIGRISKIQLQKLILGKNIHVRYFKRGKYKRILGEVFHQGKSINELMISQGYAFPYGWEYPSLLDSLHYMAKLKHNGIFKYKNFKTPWYFRKMKKRR